MTDTKLPKPIKSSGVSVRHKALLTAKFSLTSVQMKILSYIFTLVDRKAVSLQRFAVPMVELAQAIGFTSRRYREYLEQATKELMEHVVVIEVGNETVQTHWLSEVVYHHDVGIMTIKISEAMEQFLLKLQGNYFVGRHKDIVPLTSPYAIRLHDILSMEINQHIFYEGDSHIKKEYPLEQLKQNMGVEGGVYDQYKYFKDKILKEAKKDIEEHTKIRLSFGEKKRGRRVEAVEFDAHLVIEGDASIDSDTGDNKLKQFEPISTLPALSEIEKRLIKYHGFSEARARKTSFKYTKEELEQSLEASLEYAAKNKRIGSIAAVTMKAIQEGWQPVSVKTEAEDARNHILEEINLADSQIKNAWWKSIKKLLLERVGLSTYYSWYMDLDFESMSMSGELTLKTPMRFKREYLKERLDAPSLIKGLAVEVQSDIQVHSVVIK
jgi:plasmid replication initiation protein